MIERWQKKLGLEEWTIDAEQIDPASVGIMPSEVSLHATIFHDRPLAEEDVVHELLHVKYPNESEEWIVNKTKETLWENQKNSS